MEYKIIGGGHIAYFDNTARTVRQNPSPGAAQQTAGSKGDSTAGAGGKASPFAAALQSAAQSRGNPPQSSPTNAATVAARTGAPRNGRSGQAAPDASRQAAMGRVAPASVPATARASRQAMTPVAAQTSSQTSAPTLPSSSALAQTSLLPAAAAAATRTVSAERSHTVKAGDTVWELAVKVYKVDPEEILRLNDISDPRSLQIGTVLRIPGKIESTSSEAVVASWYGAEHHGRPMANGAPYNMFAPTIAHKELPLGTRVLLENPATGETATATVTDRGPYIAGRDVDLSYHLAQRLSLERQGVGGLTMRIL